MIGLRPAPATIASGPPITAPTAFDPLWRSEVHEAPIAVSAPIPLAAPIALRLYGDGRLGRIGGLALHSGRSASGLEHVEQPFVHRFGPGVGGAGRDPLAQIRCGNLNVGALPVHRSPLYAFQS